jgi:uncharacterized protein YjlB
MYSKPKLRVMKHEDIEGVLELITASAYPKGQSWDMNYGKAGERPRADMNIRKVPLPAADPVVGKKGPLIVHWTSRTS